VWIILGKTSAIFHLVWKYCKLSVTNISEEVSASIFKVELKFFCPEDAGSRFL
jgi:hypothetical protein